MTRKKILPLILIIIGVLFLAQVTIPLIGYKIWEMTNLNESDFPSPIKSSYMAGISIQNKDNFPAFISNLTRSTIAPYPQFKLSIPKLDMTEATVTIDSNDLDKGLAHLPGSALPGERGNVFISGHSSILFDNNFSKLSKLKMGDEIKIKIGETDFIYKVLDTKVVDPTDVSVIAPPEGEGRYLSLMTCVPPGLNIKRLVVLANLI